MRYIDDARHDVRATFRLARRRPASTFVAVLLLALAIGTTTTLSSLIYGVLYRPLPWAESDRLLRLEETRGGERGRVPWTISNATYLAWRDSHDTVEDVGGWRTVTQALDTVGDERTRLPMAAVTPSLLTILRAQPAVGRAFVESDVAPGAPGSVLLAHGLWQRAFGGRTDIVGQQVRLDGRPHTVVGVMPPGFAFPDHTTQAWVPMTVIPVLGDNDSRRVMIFAAMARLRGAATMAQAAAEATARARHAPDLAQAALALFGNNGEVSVVAASARDVLTRNARPGLLILLGAIVLLFVTAVASAAGVQVARAAQRRREIAIRAALGAGSTRLARQWVVESVVLGLAGVGVGLAFAVAGHRMLPRLLPLEFPRTADVRLDFAVVTVSCVVAVAISVACGLVPAWFGRRANLVEVLSEDGTAPVGGSLRSAAGRVRLVITTLQVAIACLLLVTTALLGRSFVNLLTADRGYDPRNLLTARIPLPASSTFEQRAAALADMAARLQAQPGVTHVAFGNALPFVTSGGFRGMTIPAPLDPSRTIELQTAVRAVSPAYLDALRLRLRSGRWLLSTDTTGAPRVVVVNRSFAAQYLGDRPVGRRLALGQDLGGDWEVVGVVDDMQQGGLGSTASASTFGGVTDPAQPEMFFALPQWGRALQELVVVLRTTDDPTRMVPALRSVVRAADATLALDSVMTMDERVMSSLALPRAYAVVLAALALFALAIVGVGLFGVLSHAIAQRTREIGVRTALGATARDVLTLVLRHAALSVAAGLGLGVAGALTVVGTLRSQMYGVSPGDPLSFFTAVAVIAAVALGACLVPARRATRVDPLVALRS